MNSPIKYSPQSSRSMQKVQELTLKILESSPGLTKDFSTDPTLRQGVKQTLPQINPLQKVPSLFAEPSIMTNPSTTMSPFQKQTLLIQEWQKRYNDLESKHRKLQIDFVTCKNDEKLKELRYIKREEAFKQFIRELETRLQAFSSPEENQKMKEITQLHNNVLQRIENIQAHTSKQFLEHEKDIIKFFDNKMREIKQEYEEEKVKYLEKNKNFSVREENLVAEIEWVKTIAKKIDDENQSLSKRCQDLKASQPSKNEEEKNQQKMMKLKRKNAVLKTQVKKYEEMIQRFTVEKDLQITTPEFQNLTSDTSQSKVLNSPLDLSPGITLLEAGSEINSSRLPLTNKSRYASTDIKTSRADFYSSSPDTRFDSVINSLKAVLQKEKKQKQYFKSAYLKEIEGKSELENVLRECIQEVRNSLSKVKNEKLSPRKKLLKSVTTTDSETQPIINKLLADERILALIYDKTFYRS